MGGGRRERLRHRRAPAGIAEAIDRLAADRSLAEKMGEAGRERVADLSWEPVVARLTES